MSVTARRVAKPPKGGCNGLEKLPRVSLQGAPFLLESERRPFELPCDMFVGGDGFLDQFSRVRSGPEVQLGVG